MSFDPRSLGRRTLLKAAALGGAGLALPGLLPAWARSGTPGVARGSETLAGEEIRLVVDHGRFNVGGRAGHAITLNGTIPGPLVRLKEGQRARIHVENRLDEDTSIHWHGLLVPFEMDGVPGVSFPGIKARSTFTYDFPVRQYGTYWYHSHSGLQEQEGHYGPLVIEPAAADPVRFDREHVIVLSDWTFLHPHALFERLKQEAGVFNRQKTTLMRRLKGKDRMAAGEREMFAKMRMDPTDILDVTGEVYTYLINGHGPRENWTGLFRPGERVRLRIINAAAMTIFNVRIPGLEMEVVAADGQNVVPVTVDEFQIGNAETYDVVVSPGAAAYSFVAEAMDRSGMGVATLAPRAGMRAQVPPLRERPLLTMKDMGMGGMDHGAHGGAPADHSGMDMRDGSKVPFELNPGVDMIAPNPVDRTGEPGLGLDKVGHRALNYRQLVSLQPNPDTRAPTRSIEVHLTGNMERFMWSIDGKKLSEAPEPIRFARNERVRVTMINNTMMTHPMHIHGHFFELVNGHSGRHPHKHTVNVLPGGKVSFDMTADAPGDWAFHCHLLLHMHAGMMRVVTVRPMDEAAS